MITSGFETYATTAANVTRTAPLAILRSDAARAVLRGLALAGARIVKRARSQHGSDCPCDAAHLDGPMHDCRCVRVMRVRVPSAGDWLLVFGDVQGGGAVLLSGPYDAATSLHYGGGFWERVEVLSE
jgi:hypothetical protein